jgi:ATP-binding cassette subfamily G (WHITE) protein 2
MTAHEALTFHAEVLLGRAGGDRRERTARVEAVLRVMGLAGTAGTLVGGPLPGGLLLRGLSGERRPRAGCATVSRPACKMPANEGAAEGARELYAAACACQLR